MLVTRLGAKEVMWFVSKFTQHGEKKQRVQLSHTSTPLSSEVTIVCLQFKWRASLEKEKAFRSLVKYTGHWKLGEDSNAVSTSPTRVLVSVSHDKACTIWKQRTGQDYTFIRCLPCAPDCVWTSHSIFLSLTQILWGVIIPGLKTRRRDGAESGSNGKAPAFPTTLHCPEQI